MIAADPRGRARLLLLACGLFPVAAPVHAEIGASLTFASQDRFRGYSVSDGHPAATLSLSYDDADGPYVEGSVMASGTPSDGVHRFRFEGNAGYALRLKQGPTIDAGIVHADYSGYRIYGYKVSYTEVYVGLITGNVAAHLHYAPNYFQRGVRTIYSDVQGSIPLTPHIRLNAHYGMLFQTHGIREQAGRTTRDWRIGASTAIDKLNFELAVASGVKKRSIYGEAKDGGTALLLAMTAVF
jgi:uncharacterized protein (TIGR02001 family)